MAAINRVEKLSQIDVHDPATPHLHRLTPQRADGRVGAAVRSEPVRDVQKVRLIHRFQHHQHRTLEDLILERRYPQRPGLVGRALLGDVHPPHRRSHVRAGLGAVQEVLKVVHQVDLVVRRSLSVHADRSVFAGLAIGLEQPSDVHVVRQRRERHVRAVPGEFRDPSSFRGHGIRSRRTWHVSLRRFVKWCPLPSPGSLGMVPPLHRYHEAL